MDLKEIADKPECDEQFWRELMGLTDKFSALGNYDREEALFELKKGSLESRKNALNNTLRQLEIE